jgi:hypothetical protein
MAAIAIIEYINAGKYIIAATMAAIARELLLPYGGNNSSTRTYQSLRNHTFY